MAEAIPMYQGEDFSQQLSYFSDVAMTTPLVFTEPVMDLRDQDGTLLAVFDETGVQKGLIVITGPGVIELRMTHALTVDVPAGSYALDIFANVGSVREAITKRGLLSLKVVARITQDPG